MGGSYIGDSVGEVEESLGDEGPGNDLLEENDHNLDLGGGVPGDVGVEQSEEVLVEDLLQRGLLHDGVVDVVDEDDELLQLDLLEVGVVFLEGLLDLEAQVLLQPQDRAVRVVWPELGGGVQLGGHIRECECRFDQIKLIHGKYVMYH